MQDEIICPKCHKRNDIQKFCIYCGHRLLNTEQIELILENPEAYCLNCGRAVKKDQAKCECGYEFRIIDCPKCYTKNAYANKFCTDCGKKLWSSNVCEINYDKITPSIFKDKFPPEMQNTILHLRYKHTLGINFPEDLKRSVVIRIHSNQMNQRWMII